MTFGGALGAGKIQSTTGCRVHTVTPTTVIFSGLDCSASARGLEVHDVQVPDPFLARQELEALEPPSDEEDVDLPGLGEVGDDKAQLASGLLEVEDVEGLVVGNIQPQAVALGDVG